MKFTEINAPLRRTVSSRSEKFMQGTFAANAGSSLLGAIVIPLNMLAHVQVIVKASAGTNAVIAPSAVNAGTDQFTATAHGIQTGNPVTVGFTAGGAVPGGTVANTIYYARAVDANTLTLHATQAGAVAGTGLVDITSTGTTPLLLFSFHTAYYILRATARNRFTNTTIVGSVTVVAVYEDIAAWDATVNINDATDSLEVKVTPDATQATTFEAETVVDLVSIGV